MMKIKANFVLRQVAKSWMVLPLAEQNKNLNGVLSLTESGALLWRQLEEGCDMQTLADALVQEYGIPREKALADASKFTEKLMQLGCLDAD
jgi:hypothetical protein